MKDRNYLETPDGLRVGPEMWRSKCIELAEVTAERDAKDAACGRWHRALVKVTAERDGLECLLREIADRIDAALKGDDDD